MSITVRILIGLLVAVAIFSFLFVRIMKLNKLQKDIHNRVLDLSKEQKLEAKQPHAGIYVDVGAGVKEKKQEKNVKVQAVSLIKTTTQKLNLSDKRWGITDVIDLRMQQAGWPLLGNEFIVMLVIVGFVVGLVAGILTLSIATFFVGLVVGIVAVVAILNISISRRRSAFNNQLPDVLNMIANALRAGFSFQQAFELVAKEMDDPVRSEVSRVVRDSNVGITLEVALENMNKRVASTEFALVVTAVLIQRQVGGNLAQILDSISNTINDRIRMKREVMALTAQGRMSGVVLALLPFAVGFGLITIKPTYLDPLFNSELGQMALVASGVMELVGFFVINKIVDIDV